MVYIYTDSDILTVRQMIGDMPQASVSDVLDPLPDGAISIFQLSNYPVNKVSPIISIVTIGPDGPTSNPIGASLIDSDNGVIRTGEAPSADTDYLQADYYTWSHIPDSLILQALTLHNGSWRRAAIDILMYILADPQGTFFKTYQTGDDNVDDGKFSVPRIQAVVTELWRQEGLPEYAGTTDVNWPQRYPLDALVNDRGTEGLPYLVRAKNDERALM